MDNLESDQLPLDLLNDTIETDGPVTPRVCVVFDKQLNWNFFKSTYLNEKAIA